MKRLIVLLCGMLMLPGVAVSADVYKWKDADGKIRYSDIPPSSNIQYEKLIGGRPSAAGSPSTAESDKSSTSQGDKEGDARKRKTEADNLKKKDLEKQDEQKVRAENCAIAKSNMQGYKQGGRMYKVDENGERHYLDEKDIAEGLEKANKDIEQWCN